MNHGSWRVTSHLQPDEPARIIDEEPGYMQDPLLLLESLYRCSDVVTALAREIWITQGYHSFVTFITPSLLLNIQRYQNVNNFINIGVWDTRERVYASLTGAFVCWFDLTQTLGWWHGKFSPHFCSTQSSLLNRNILWKAPHTCADQWQNKTDSRILITLDLFNNSSAIVINETVHCPIMSQSSTPILTLECLPQNPSLSLANRASLPVPLKTRCSQQWKTWKTSQLQPLVLSEKNPDLEPGPVLPTGYPAEDMTRIQGNRSNRTNSVGLYHQTQRTHIQLKHQPWSDGAVVIHVSVSPVLVANSWKKSFPEKESPSNRAASVRKSKAVQALVQTKDTTPWLPLSAMLRCKFQKKSLLQGFRKAHLESTRGENPNRKHEQAWYV